MIWTWRGWRAGGPGPGRTVWYWCWTRSHSRGCRWPSGAPVCKLHGRRPRTVPEARSDKPAAGFSWSHCRHRKPEDKRSIWTCSNPNQDPGTSDYIQVKPYPPSLSLLLPVLHDCSLPWFLLLFVVYLIVSKCSSAAHSMGCIHRVECAYCNRFG